MPPRAMNRAVSVRRTAYRTSDTDAPAMPSEGPQVLHGDLIRLHEVVEPAVEARLGLGWWYRFHFQKNALISGTFEPPEMYSTALS